MIRVALIFSGINNTVFPVTKFAQNQNKARIAETEKIKQDGRLDEESGKGVDLLMKFTQARTSCILTIIATIMADRGDCRTRPSGVHDRQASSGIMHEHDLCRLRDDSD